MQNKDFLNKYPRVIGVGLCIYVTISIYKKIKGKTPDVFREIGVRDTQGFLEAVYNGNEKAVSTYTSIENQLIEQLIENSRKLYREMERQKKEKELGFDLDGYDGWLNPMD